MSVAELIALLERYPQDYTVAMPDGLDITGARIIADVVFLTDEQDEEGSK